MTFEYFLNLDAPNLVFLCAYLIDIFEDGVYVNHLNLLHKQKCIILYCIMYYKQQQILFLGSGNVLRSVCTGICSTYCIYVFE